MADIFISYASEDRSRVEPLAKLLEKQGWSVFWDFTIPVGETWRHLITEALDAAKCAVVVWSKKSINSDWVHEEAEEAQERRILVPTMIDNVKPPLGFRRMQAARLTKWKGEPNHPEFKKLLESIEAILGPSPLKVKDEQKRAEEEQRRKEKEERKRRELKTAVKTDKFESDAKATIESMPSELGKTSKRLKFGAAGVVALLVVGIWWYFSKSPKTFTNTIGMNFVLIPAGSFTMGSQLRPEEVARRYGGEAEFNKDEQPPHLVEITKPFYLQIIEVSQGQWKRVMGNNPSQFKDCVDDCPVENVSWDDTQKFISKLNQMEGTNKYRLPTEAEWEYACRAGTTTPFFTGDCISTDQANYHGENPGKNCPKGIFRKRPANVGSFQPNAWDLYDMHGNVWEWCQDWDGDYPSGSVADPKGPDRGKSRVMRGGSWNSSAEYLRSAGRYRGDPGNSYYYGDIGFRVARDF